MTRSWSQGVNTGVATDRVNSPSWTPSDTWNQVVAELDREQVRRALATLPLEQRTTIEMAYFGGYSQSEIGSAMRVPLGTVKGRIRLGLRALRSVLGEWGVEQPA